ncbi:MULTISPECIES: hypothetical protein [Elizabethkingia]|uniref:hypothetical protein n=1 Tax=Elizabethkingia TaxID=308865 RepID=UPI000995B9A4|nr:MULTISPECIES: hypothetical protein [Elizabethkingia]AQW93061.1 hypothetical protein BBD30_02085 [Elizabethkingia anophelis]OPB61122.1 hypothetical protein BAS07_01515 [Elizabethkingia anophelis]OPC53539.1 hypothetical protein BAY07_15940 [Elizabethkingia bruuniana]
MKKIIVLLVLNIVFFSYGQKVKYQEENQPYFEILSIVNRPNGEFSKILRYRLVNPTDHEIKVILDNNFLNRDKKFDEWSRDEIEKRKGQVRITIQDPEMSIIPTTYSTGGVLRKEYDSLIDKDPKQFVEKYTHVIKPHTAKEFNTSIPLVENCKHCKDYLSHTYTYLIKVDTVYKLTVQLDNNEFLNVYAPYLDNKESYYAKPIKSKPFYFKDVLIKRDETHDIDLYQNVTKLK